MSTAWLFVGQDAFQPRTGLAEAEAMPEVRTALEFASELCGLDLLDRRERRRVAQFDTSVLQPLLTAVCVGTARHLAAAGLAPDVVAGASMGEVPAWAIACEVPTETAVTVARERGLAMAEAARRHPGTMRALRATEAEVEQLLTQPGIELGARNGESDWVLTGDSDALSAASGRAVPVTGPWHASTMAAAAPALRAAMPAPGKLVVPFVLNDAGRTAHDAADVHAHLVRQLTHPAQWFETLRALEARGVQQAVVIGPPRVLRSQLRRVAPGLQFLTPHDRTQESPP